MKAEYKIRAVENLEAVTKRVNVITEMLEGKRPADTTEAIKLSKEIQKLVEQTQNIVELS